MDAGAAYKAQVFLEQRKNGKSKEEATVRMKKSWRGLVGSEGY